MSSSDSLLVNEIVDIAPDIEAVRKVTKCIKAFSNLCRLKLFKYCFIKRSHSDIVFSLKINPASLRFHMKILIDSGLIKKVDRGEYEVTDFGRMFDKILNQAKVIVLNEKND